MNVHIHPVTLDNASRVLKGLASAGRSRCFHQRLFLGAGPSRHYEYKDSEGTVQVHLFPRASHSRSGFLKKAVATWNWTRCVAAHARTLPMSCLNVHGLSTLPLGVKLKRLHGCKLIYDTHELETRVSASRGLRRFYSQNLERALIRHCDAVICVSDGIADWYARNYGIPRPLVVRNVPDRRFQAANKATQDLRTRYRIPSAGLLFLYQGKLAAGRQIEQFLRVFLKLPPSYHLLFMGNGPHEMLIRQAADNHSNIHLAPAVPPDDVLAYTAQADVGLVGMEDSCLNHRLSLPNKLFEYIIAGVPVIIPDFPEMRRLLEHYRAGWSWSGEIANFEKLLRSLSREAILTQKAYRDPTASELSWENEERALLQLYRSLLPRVEATALQAA